MKMQFSKLAMAAAFGLALAFTFSCSSDKGGDDNLYGSVADNSGRTYKTVKIGEQWWMAENLNYDVPGNDTDVCYENDPDKCAKYGRLYNLSTAMTACPINWHIPSDQDWKKLFRYVDLQNGGDGVEIVFGSFTVGKYLKATSGWNENDNGTDDYGFSALPGGFGDPEDGYFGGAGKRGYWWSASNCYNLTSYQGGCSYYYEPEDYEYTIFFPRNLHSVRCIKD